MLQTNKALKYISENSERFHADPLHFILAGDSGGAHIAAQTANIISDSTYSELMGIVPTIKRAQLRGLILYCGAYNADSISIKGDYADFLKTVLWSYSGKRNYDVDDKFKAASVINYISDGFPPCFISAGNGDPLLSQSKSLANKLIKLNVKVDTLFFKKEIKPKLPHEYQFNLDELAGKLALKRSLIFLKELHLTDQ